MWYDRVLQMFKLPDLRNKILFVLLIFVVFRLMANIPIPGVDAERLQAFFASNQIFGLFNIFTGGTLERMSIAMLGLGPYITAVIIMQLLTMVFPALEQMYKEEGEAGRQKFNQYARIGTVPLAMLQGYGFITLLVRQKVLDPLPLDLLLSSILTIAAGTLFLMWLGELISEKNIGNGVSLLIFAGIVAGVPTSVGQIVANWDKSQLPMYLIFFAIALLVIAGVVIINEGRRNIPVSYAKRVRGMRMYGGVSTYLPIPINPAGVIPIIFALSILLFPGMIANFFSGTGGIIGNVARNLAVFFQDPWVNGIFYFILVALFTLFYTAVTFDPNTIASDLQKMGGFVPGIRPGQTTARFLKYILNRILLIGAIFLGLIAVLPSIIGGLTGITAFRFLVGGTSVLIVVSVVLESVRQIKAQLEMREYETF